MSAMPLAHISLFSGVGGFELAASEAGIPTLAACEIDNAARGVLADHFPDTHIYHDVKGVAKRLAAVASSCHGTGAAA